MKKILLILVVTILAVGQALAQGAGGNNISITDLKLTNEGDDVTLTFNFMTGPQVVEKRDQSLRITPVLEKDGRYEEFTPILVQGKRARISYERSIKAGGTPAGAAVTIGAGESMSYTSTLPLKMWMMGANLMLEGYSETCCNIEDLTLGLLAENVLELEKQPEVVIVEVVKPEAPKTTGDQIAEEYPFVMLDPGFDMFSPEHRDQSLSIYFRQGNMSVERNYRKNSESLDELIRIINKIDASADSRVSHIDIAGYASPEGSQAVNERLARERATGLKDYVSTNTSIPASMIRVHNGAVDWEGLKKMVEESNMPDKQAVLSIIENVPVWDAQKKTGRLGELMRLSGGAPYRYMYQNFFPEMRNATYIMIYYKNK